jgi:hypothetical protein
MCLKRILMNTLPIAKVSIASALMLFLFAALSVAPSSAADIYKSTDDHGRMVYSDHPLTYTAQKIVVRTESSDPEVVRAQIDEEAAQLAESEAARRSKAETDRAARADKEQKELEKARDCELAQGRLRLLANANNATYWDEQKNAIAYYSREEVAMQRANAQEAVTQACE